MSTLTKSQARRARGPEPIPAPLSRTKRTRGRPTLFNEQLVADALFAARLGATDMEIAETLGIDVTSLYLYYGQYPEFSHAMREAKDLVDERVERSLLQRAVGYKQNVEKVFSNGSRVSVVERVQADTAAASLWLRNRRGWRNNTDVSLVVPETTPTDETVDTPTRELALAALALMNEAAYNPELDGPLIEGSASTDEEEADDGRTTETDAEAEEEFEDEDEEFDPDFDL